MLKISKKLGSSLIFFFSFYKNISIFWNFFKKMVIILFLIFFKVFLLSILLYLCFFFKFIFKNILIIIDVFYLRTYRYALCEVSLKAFNKRWRPFLSKKKRLRMYAIIYRFFKNFLFGDTRSSLKKNTLFFFFFKKKILFNFNLAKKFSGNANINVILYYYFIFFFKLKRVRYVYFNFFFKNDLKTYQVFSFMHFLVRCILKKKLIIFSSNYFCNNESNFFILKNFRKVHIFRNEQHFERNFLYNKTSSRKKSPYKLINLIYIKPNFKYFAKMSVLYDSLLTRLAKKKNKKKKINLVFYKTNFFLKTFKFCKCFFLRKQKCFNKGRYSRTRQNYRTGVYWCLYLNIIALLGFNFLFYKFTINFLYYWWFWFLFFSVFFFNVFLRYKIYSIYSLKEYIMYVCRFYYSFFESIFSIFAFVVNFDLLNLLLNNYLELFFLDFSIFFLKNKVLVKDNSLIYIKPKLFNPYKELYKKK